MTYCDENNLRPYLIREALDDRLTLAEQDYFDNSVMEIQNEYIVIGQRYGLEACIAAIQEAARP